MEVKVSKLAAENITELPEWDAIVKQSSLEVTDLIRDVIGALREGRTYKATYLAGRVDQILEIGELPNHCLPSQHKGVNGHKGKELDEEELN